MKQRENTVFEDDLFTSPIATSSSNIIRNFVTTLIFFFFSQNIFPQFTTPVFENISIEDGLPGNSVNCIIQNHPGYLQLSTQNDISGNLEGRIIDTTGNYLEGAYGHEKDDPSQVSYGGEKSPLGLAHS